MDSSTLRGVLRDLSAGRTGVGETMARLKDLPFEDLGFARIDHHRPLRRGFPEVIYCEGKTVEQILRIGRRQIAHGETVFGTRASREALDAVRGEIDGAGISETGRCFWKKSPSWKRAKKSRGTIVIVCAGTSDLAVAEEARCTVEILGRRPKLICDVGVAGIHRLAACKEDFARASVIIAIAGMEGALPSVIAGLVSCPVIGVPTSVGYGSHFGGLVPLFAMLNSCASGLTVVNVDNGFGAAVAASMIDS
jgi:NCAIR mutase (PurE)-related protein